MDRVTYHVCDLVSGVVLDTLPLSGQVAKTRGEVESVTWQMAVADERIPDNWAWITQPWKSMVVAEWQGRLIQGWVLVSRKFGGWTVDLQAATLERLTERVLVRDGEWNRVDRAQIMAEIIGQVMVPEGGWSVQWQPVGVKADAFHALDGAVTVHSALETEEAAEGGPQWMAQVHWVVGEEGRRVQKVIQLGRPLGTDKPEAIFDLSPGEYTRTDDWTGDNAALEVWGVTEGSGGKGITQGSYVSPKLARGWHPNEAFVSFTDLDESELETRAKATLADLQNGLTVWDATVRIDEAPLLGDEWNIGDTITLRAKPSRWDPIGGELTAECEGWVLDDKAGTITPRVAQDEQ